MRKAWMRRVASFEEADACDLADYQAMTPSQRLEILQQLREEYAKFGGNNARPERLRGVAVMSPL